MRLSFFIAYETTALHRFEKHYMTVILCQSRAQNSDGSAKILERSKIPIEYTMQPCIVRENNNDTQCAQECLGLQFMLSPSPWGHFYSKVIPNHPSEQ